MSSTNYLEEVELEDVEWEAREELIAEAVEIIDSEPRQKTKGNQPRVVADLKAEDATGNEENSREFYQRKLLKASEEDDAPAQTVMTAGATADPVKDYLKQMDRTLVWHFSRNSPNSKK